MSEMTSISKMFDLRNAILNNSLQSFSSLLPPLLAIESALSLLQVCLSRRALFPEVYSRLWSYIPVSVLLPFLCTHCTLAQLAMLKVPSITQDYAETIKAAVQREEDQFVRLALRWGCAIRDTLRECMLRGRYAIALEVIENMSYTPCNHEDLFVFLAAQQLQVHPLKHQQIFDLLETLIMKNTHFHSKQLNEQRKSIYEVVPSDFYLRIDKIIKRKEGESRNIISLGDQFQIEQRANKVYKNYVQSQETLLAPPVVEKKLILPVQELKYYLEEEIKYETEKIKAQNSRSRQFYEQLISLIQASLCVKLPHLVREVRVFGSFATNLSLPESDIDLVILPSGDAGATEILEIVLGELNAMEGVIESSRLIKTAFIPVIKALSTPRYSNKQIDISVKDDNHNGLQFYELTITYLEYYPALEPLLLVIKKYIYECQLHNPYTGGISSSSLLFMIVAHLQNEEYYHHKAASLGELMLSFFNFFGFKMDYVNKCIKVENPLQMEAYKGCIYRYAQLNEYLVEPKLIILDPWTHATNLARATHKIKLIRTAFEKAFILLHVCGNCTRKPLCELYQRIGGIYLPPEFRDNRRPCCILKRLFKNAPKCPQQNI